MMTIYSVSSPRDQDALFREFDPEQATWLVSDLRSKLELSRTLLTTREFLPGQSLLRASELWKVLISRLRPDLQIISREFAVTLIGQKLAATDLAWAKAPGAAPAAADYMTQFMPILAHPNGEEMMTEWLESEDNVASATRWGRWFKLAVQLWKEFLEDGFIAPQWAAGVLVNEPDLKATWTRPLYVDLGAELNQVEADLFVLLSEVVDIHVLRPEPSWIGEYAKTMVAYQIFEAKLKVSKKSLAVAVEASGRKEFRKYTTMIAEVKAAVQQAREWLDAGANPREIAVVAPDIEAYWPALSSYLNEEGLPVAKDQVRRLHTYPDIARFMAQLRLRAGAFDESDLELALFDLEDSRFIKYDDFKKLYGTLYAREDLGRMEKVEARFTIDLSDDALVARDEFVGWSLRQLPAESDLQRVSDLYKRLFAEVPQGMTLDAKRWLRYLEQLASKVECRIRKGDPEGIAALSLTSAENSSAQKMIVLGLTESHLRKNGGTAVLFSDVWSLGQQFGFHLASEDQARLEFEARWVTENSDRELILCVPETDFNGAAQAPAWLWVRGSREGGEKVHLTVPPDTRWDEVQKSALVTIASGRNWSEAHRSSLETAFREDLGEKVLDSFGDNLVTSLSPSGIEDYLNCPFIFAAKRLLGLSDVAEVDLEVDPSRRGSLMHKIFELLATEPVKLDATDEEIGVRVEEAREAIKLELADARLWAPLKEKHVDLGRRFLAFEKELRTQFPQAKTLASEVEIAGYIRPSTGELMKNPEPGALKFIGRIDRIDKDAQGNLAIYDYKSSAGTASQFGSWIQKNKIQLLLYAIAVENGLTKFEPLPVVSAMYYVARPLARDNGFKVENVEQGLYELTDRRKRNRLTEEQKVSFFKEGEALVKKAIDGISAGRFDPNPRDRAQCKICLWSAVCRAPHLNS